MIEALGRSLEKLGSERDLLPDGVQLMPSDVSALLPSEIESLLENAGVTSQGYFSSIDYNRQVLHGFVKREKLVQDLCAQVQSQSRAVESLTREYFECSRSVEEKNRQLDEERKERLNKKAAVASDPCCSNVIRKPQRQKTRRKNRRKPLTTSKCTDTDCCLSRINTHSSLLDSCTSIRPQRCHIINYRNASICRLYLQQCCREGRRRSPE